MLTPPAPDIDPETAGIGRLFADGNYTGVLLREREDLWQTHAARALIGQSAEALDGLSRFRSPTARFYEAVAHWMSGDETAAVAILSTLDDAHARNLLALIRRPRLRVLTMLPSPAHGPHVLLPGSVNDAKFELTNVGYGRDDEPCRPDADIFDYADPTRPPDFLVCVMVEWHAIPPNLTDLPCPLLGHTADFDLHLHPVLPWLRLFDEIIVTDHTEHEGAHGLVSCPVTTFPKVFGRPPTLPLPRRGERDIDLFLSGTLFAPAHPDKAALIHELLDLDGVRLLGFNGFLGERAYYDLLARSRVSIAYCRHSGAMVTRGIEAACMGCVTLVQEGSVLTLFGGNGLVTYPSWPGGAARAVRHVLDHYPEYERRAWRAALPFRQALAPDVVASHYLRYCTVLAARPRPPRALRSRPVQKQVPFWKGWQPGGGKPERVAALRRTAIARLEEELTCAPSAATVNAIARELLLDAGRRLIRGETAPNGEGETPESLAAEALKLYRTWLPRFPHALAARFNYLRAAIHFGGIEQIVSAWTLFQEVKAPADGTAGIAAEDDLFPYDWGEIHFDYRTVLDHAMAMLGRGAPAEPLVGAILGTVDHYLARINDDANLARRAVERVPAFPWYTLDLAKRLAAQADPAARAEAVVHLSGLCRSSALSIQAFHVLSRLRNEGTAVPDFPALARRAARIETALFDAESAYLQVSSLYHATQAIHGGGRRGVQVRNQRKGIARASAVFVDPAYERHGSFLHALRAAAGDVIEIVCVNPYDDLLESVVGQADVVLACGQFDLRPHIGRAANHGLLAASGEIVLLLAEPPADAAVLRTILDAVERDGVPTIERNAEGSLCAIAALREDLLLWGCFDEHEALARRTDAFDELAARIGRQVRAVRRVGPPGPAGDTAWNPDATLRLLWPELPEPRIRPMRTNAHFNLVGALLNGGIDRIRKRELSGAQRRLQAAAALAPERFEIWSELGRAIAGAGRHEDAAVTYRRSLLLDATTPRAHTAMAQDRFDEGRPKEALAILRQCLALAPADEALYRHQRTILLYTPGLDERTRFSLHRRHATLAASPPTAPAVMRPAAGRRLRIGYVSSDFRSLGGALSRPHPVTANMEPILRHRSREAFEVFVYAEIARPDATTQRIRSQVDGWRSILGLSDDAAATAIRDDGIDVLVFLAGHFDANRLSIAALRPAPVQISFHDVATAGVDGIDALIADPILAPRHGQEIFVERVVRLPSFYVHAPLEDAPAPGPLPLSRNGHLTFGSFNNPAKLNDEVLDLWGRLMTAAPGSHLVLQYQDRFAAPNLRERVLTGLNRHGIRAECIRFIDEAVSATGHLALYRDVDLALDPFPFSGSTTTFEGLWMGVPALTLPGSNMVGRWTASILTSAGCPEFIAASPDAAVAIVRRCVANPRPLTALRTSLRERILASPIVDGRLKARQLERLYWALWRCAATGLDRHPC